VGITNLGRSVSVRILFSVARFHCFFFILQNSANIIVQNQMTGQLEEEKMKVYVRLGIRLLYKGATSRMEGARSMFN
jgi:hypothetical protein